MANIRLTANERAFVNSMDNAAGSVGRLSASLNIQLARAMRETDNITRNFAQGFGRLGDRISGVGQTLTSAFTLPIAVAAGAAAKFYGDIDQLKRALDVYGVSLNEIKKTAKLPGLGIEEAGKATINFLSVKYAADLSNRAVREFGNALVYSGRGKEDLAGIANAFAQMKGKGIISAEEVNQLAERLPMIRDLMQSAFGTSSTEAIQKLGITADEFLGKIVTQLEKLPRVSGGFKTAWENVIDSVKLGSYEVVNIADKLFDLTGILDVISGYIDRAVNSFKDMPVEFQKTIFAVGGFVAIAGPLLVALGGIIALSGPVITAIAGISLPVVAVSAVFVAFTATVIRNWSQISGVLKDTGVWQGLVSVVKFTVGVIGEAFALLFDALSGDWTSFGTRLLNIVKRIYNDIVDVTFFFINGLLNAFQSILKPEWMKAGLESAKMALGSFQSKIKADVPVATDYLKKLGDSINSLGNVKIPTVTGGGSTGKGIDLEELKKQRDILGKLNLKELTSIGEKEFSQNYGKKALPTFFQDILDAGVRLKNEMPKIMSGLDMSQAGSTIEDQIRTNVTNRAKLAFLEFNDMAEKLTKQLKIDLVVNAITGVGEAIGQAMGGKGFDISKVFKSMLMTIGDYMIKLGVQSVGMQKLILLLQGTFGTISGIGAAIAVTAGGAALKGLAGSLFSNTPKFANGGIVSGPTLGLMGEYAGARSNPEVIAPLSKLKDLLGGGGSSVIPDVKILGEDIYISFNRYKKRTGNA
jgi:tape measure domain-containing protein